MKNFYHFSLSGVAFFINKDPQYCKELARSLKANVVYGDASDPQILEDAGGYKTDILVALTPKDHDNLFICKMAQKYFNVERTTALVNNPDNECLFKKIGITSIFNTTQLLSSLIEQHVAVEDISNLITLEDGKLSVAQIIIPENAPSVGKTVKELDLPLSIVLGGIIRNGDIVIPRGGTIIKPGDKVLVISLPQDQAKAVKALGGEE
ncbi:potassium channel family protein [Halothermothrix orenii]|uniref:TrkA-C domain protein n=1 Tax=Halothermothrix orenii (strain H 168 / OCM 544 / DSM 9562) TaxID=373903 RepID=B8CX95_HALOH|nr:NAD-binding protein [Halothermothrix orenii]ACL69914.1 TrkA-C domain protein [Halothermothrix orenii H 168]